MMPWLYLQDYLFSAGGLAVMLVQLGCVVHVLKSGRPYWWCWVIFGFPLIGAAAYVLFEVRPAWGKLNWDSLLWRLKSSDERIRIRREQMEDSGSMKNRLRLADELQDAGRYDQACEVLEEGLRGAFAGDSEVLLRLAESHLEAGRAGEAAKLLERITPERSSDFQLRFKLMRARTLGKLGQEREATTLFQELSSLKRSEAPRYYYAELLRQTNQCDEARKILNDILYRYRRGTAVWRYQEERWYYAAHRLLKSLPRGEVAYATGGIQASSKS